MTADRRSPLMAYTEMDAAGHIVLHTNRQPDFNDPDDKNTILSLLKKLNAERGFEDASIITHIPSLKEEPDKEDNDYSGLIAIVTTLAFFTGFLWLVFISPWQSITLPLFAFASLIWWCITVFIVMVMIQDRETKGVRE